MKVILWLRATTAVLVVLMLGTAAPAVAGEGGVPGAAGYWFAPMEQMVRPNGALAGYLDYFDLFAPDAPWSRAASGLAIFKVYPVAARCER